MLPISEVDCVLPPVACQELIYLKHLQIDLIPENNSSISIENDNQYGLSPVMNPVRHLKDKVHGFWVSFHS